MRFCRSVPIGTVYVQRCTYNAEQPLGIVKDAGLGKIGDVSMGTPKWGSREGGFPILGRALLAAVAGIYQMQHILIETFGGFFRRALRAPSG
jgi:hypothetical protein